MGSCGYARHFPPEPMHASNFHCWPDADLRGGPLWHCFRGIAEIKRADPSRAIYEYSAQDALCRRWFYCRPLIRLNSASARSNLWLKSHIASKISRKVADVLTRSARPYAKMLLFRRYPMILGSEIL